MLALSAVLALGACAVPEFESFRAPDASNLFRKTSVTNFRDKQLGPVAPEDFVDAGGRCAGAYAPPVGGDPTAAQDVAIPTVPSAIALEMTECDVVKRAGDPERVAIGTNDRNERTASLTYINGQRPGIYNFTSGRLTSMELAPEPPTPVRAAKKPAKPAKRAAQPARNSVQ